MASNQVLNKLTAKSQLMLSITALGLARWCRTRRKLIRFWIPCMCQAEVHRRKGCRQRQRSQDHRISVAIARNQVTIDVYALNCCWYEICSYLFFACVLLIIDVHVIYCILLCRISRLNCGVYIQHELTMSQRKSCAIQLCVTWSLHSISSWQ